MDTLASNDTVVQATACHACTVILLHGRGSSGPEFQSELFESAGSDGKTLPELLPTVKWVFPTAQKRMSTIFQESITEWFDIYSLSDPDARQDLQVDGLRDSMRSIHATVDRESGLVRSRGLYIGGISQGCATACHVLFSRDYPFAGFIGISGWLPFASQLEDVAMRVAAGGSSNHLGRFHTELIAGQDKALVSLTTAATKPRDERLKTRAFMCHGIDDDVVDVALGRRLRAVTTRLGLDVMWREYDTCGHWIKEPDGVDAIVEFIKMNNELSDLL